MSTSTARHGTRRSAPGRPRLPLMALHGLLLTGVISASQAFAHGGEDHGDAVSAPTPLATIAPRAQTQSDDLELVAVLSDASTQAARLFISVDRFATGEPLTGATLEVDVNGHPLAIEETSPGAYSASLAPPGPVLPGTRLSLTVSVQAGELSDLLDATLDIPGPAPRATSQGWFSLFSPYTRTPPTAVAVNAAPEAPQRLPDASLFVPKPVQHRLQLRTLAGHAAEHVASIELNGSVIADPEVSGQVQAPFAGRLQPGPTGMPLNGRRVVKGDILAYLQPIASAIDHGNQKSQLADLDAQWAMAERRVERYTQLDGAIAQKDIEDARIKRDALRERRRVVANSVDTAIALRAPVTGILSSIRQPLAGHIVDTREVLFDVIDPAHLAIEALAYEPNLTTPSATARIGDHTLALTFIGAGQQWREQALPMLFRVDPADTRLAIGQPVKVVMRTGRAIHAIAVPLRALTTLASGDDAVWLHTAPERFVLRKVQTQPLDATTVAVTEGLHDGDRIVVDGASLLSQVR